MGRAVLQLRRNTQTFWTSANITPASGEPIYALDTFVLKIGDGTTPYNSLPSIAGTSGEAAEWHDGSGPPSNGMGSNGDYYLNTSNGDIWKKISGAWSATGGNIMGPVGPAGPPGADGGDDLHYTHDQAVPSAFWVINHNLGKAPAVSVFDSANDEVEGKIDHITLNQLTLTFSAAFSGKAYCN